MPEIITTIPLLALTAVLGYLLGSVPFGLVWAKLFGLGDIREIGSGNIGATNVLRTGNKLAALLTLIGDIGKGAFAVLVARALLGDDAAQVARVAVGKGNVDEKEAEPAVAPTSPWGSWAGQGGKGDWIAMGMGVICLLLIAIAPYLTDHSFHSAFFTLVAELHPYPGN